MVDRGTVLFVDADPDLDRTVVSLRAARPGWTVAVATSWPEVLQAVARHAIDVVVAEVRLPGMEAASLLSQVQDAFPNAGRIVHTAQKHTTGIVRTVPIAHQLLPKPCSTAQLVEAIERATLLRRPVADATIEKALARVGTIPALPHAYVELQEALTDPRVSLRRIASIVEGDIGIATKLLQLVNSAYMGLPRRVSGIQDAVTILGTRTVSDLVLLLEVFNAFTPYTSVAGLSVQRIQEVSLRVGTGARRIVESQLASDAYTAGLLHDIGRLILLARMPEAWGEAMVRALRSDVTPREAELERLGFTRDQLSAYVLGLWGLPDQITQAVAFHERPSAVAHERFGLVDAVHVARAMVAWRDAEHDVPFDVDHLTALGVRDQIEGWQTRVPW